MRRLLQLVAVALFPAILQAQGYLIPRPCVAPPPAPVCPRNADCAPARVIPCPGNPIVRVSNEVKAELVGRVLRFEVTEAFVNHGPTVGEADYVFPLPKGAAFEDLKLS